MLKIDAKNNIEITRGDTLTLTLALEKDGEAYTPDAEDTIRFAVAKGYVGDAAYELIIDQSIPYDELTFTVPAAKIELLSHDQTYNYDIELTHGDGSVDTVVSGKIKTTGEAK